MAKRAPRTPRPAGETPPLIMTLQLDEITTGLFQRHRDLFFPPTLNIVPAHLTLFHKLPGEQFDTVLRATAAAIPSGPFPLTVSEVIPLGKGVAYRLASPDLSALHAKLAASFAPWLTGQDRQAFRPHVTVQNKVTKAEARRTLDLLHRDFAPFPATAEGLQLWQYQGGPWSPAAALAFNSLR